MTINQPRILQPGYILFREGDQGDHAYYIESGEIEIVKHLGMEEETIIAVIGKGELIGEMAVLQDSVRTASARVKTSSKIVELDRPSFLSRITKDSQAALHIINTLSNRLKQSTVSQKQINEIVPDQMQEGSFEHFNNSDSRIERMTLLSAFILCAILIASLIGAALIKVETTVSSYARVVPSTPNLTIETGVEGVLKDVLVQTGDIIEENQPIAIMDLSGIDVDIKSVSGQLEATKRRLTRLRQEREVIAGTRQIDTVTDPVLVARIARRNSQMAVLHEGLTMAGAELKHQKQQHNLISKEFKTAQKRHRMMGSDQMRSGAISRMDYLDSETALSEAERRKVDIGSSLVDIGGRIEKLKAEKEAFIAQWNAEIEDHIEQDKDTVTALSAQLERLHVDKEAHTIRSPVAGKVLELTARREGTVLSKGHPVAEITRSHQPLVVEAEVSPRDVETLHAGLPVSFKLDSLPFQRYGDIKGIITRVDDDAVPSRRPDTTEEFFIVRIELEADRPRLAPNDFTLRRGMTGKADMIIGLRTILSYLLDPLTGTLKTAFHEAS